MAGAPTNGEISVRPPVGIGELADSRRTSSRLDRILDDIKMVLRSPIHLELLKYPEVKNFVNI